MSTRARLTHWLPALLLVIVLLSACRSSDLLVRDSNSRRCTSYEESLRSEANWLWEKMNYARDHFRPEDSACKPHPFSHEPVRLTADERKRDPHVAYLADQLDYAALRIGDARDRWERYCQGIGPGPAVQMEEQLRLAYDSLNIVWLGLHPSQPTPTPYT